MQIDTRITWTDADGSLRVEHPAPGWEHDAWVEEMMKNVIPPHATDVTVTTIDKIPSDRSFRDAWRHCPENGVRHCLDTAKELHRRDIRLEREKHFAKTDVLQLDAINLRRDASELVEYVQELRDATKDPVIDAATSIEELKAARPAVFGKAVPELGERLAPGEAPAYDTKALENWANALNEKIARLEAANMSGVERDLQKIMSRIEEISSSQDQRIDALTKQLDFVTQNAVGKAMLTTEELPS